MQTQTSDAGLPPVMARRRLARDLRTFRETLRAGGNDPSRWSQAAVARAAKIATGTIGMIESRKRIPNEDHLSTLLTLYGQGEQLAEYQELRHVATRKGRPGRQSAVPGDDEFTALSRAAQHIQQYETVIIPGLLQTRDYARVVLSCSPAGKTEADARLQTRMCSQEILTGFSPVSLSVLIEEHALERPVGSLATMISQLNHLVVMGSRPDGNVRIQVCPTSFGVHPHMYPFTMLGFPDPEPPMVAMTTRTRQELWEEPAEVSAYFSDWNYRQGYVALTPQESMELIISKREELEKMATPFAENQWFKSSRSQQHGACVEVNLTPDAVGVRDTKNRGQGHFTVSPGKWARFIDGIKHDAF